MPRNRKINKTSKSLYDKNRRELIKLGGWASRPRKGRIPPIARLLAKVKLTETGCWNWQGATNGTYGIMLYINHHKPAYCHRISYEIFLGKIPEGMLVCHKCDNPTCVNPSHLFLGTHADNMKDMSNKDRFNKNNKRNMKIFRCDVTDIQASYKNGCSQKSLMKKYGVSRSTIYNILYNKRKTSL